VEQKSDMQANSDNERHNGGDKMRAETGALEADNRFTPASNLSNRKNS
jgi:hypothetical protein